jgi:hypothetical protein
MIVFRPCGAIDKYIAYSIFTSGVYGATALDAAFPQEKTHFAALACAK